MCSQINEERTGDVIMLDQQVFMLSVDEYQKKTGKSWDVLKAARLLVKSANHKGFIVDSVSVADRLITVLVHRAGVAE